MSIIFQVEIHFQPLDRNPKYTQASTISFTYLYVYLKFFYSP